MSSAEIDQVFDFICSAQGTPFIQFEWLMFVLTEIDREYSFGPRKELVFVTFSNLLAVGPYAPPRGGIRQSIGFERFIDSFQARNHPEVKNGGRSVEDVIQNFLESFDIKFSGVVTFDDFNNYYRKVSACYENTYEFEALMFNLWGIGDIEPTSPFGGNSDGERPMKRNPENLMFIGGRRIIDEGQTLTYKGEWRPSRVLIAQEEARAYYSTHSQTRSFQNEDEIIYQRATTSDQSERRLVKISGSTKASEVTNTSPSANNNPFAPGGKFHINGSTEYAPGAIAGSSEHGKCNQQNESKITSIISSRHLSDNNSGIGQFPSIGSSNSYRDLYAESRTSMSLSDLVNMKRNSRESYRSLASIISSHPGRFGNFLQTQGSISSTGKSRNDPESSYPQGHKNQPISRVNPIAIGRPSMEDDKQAVVVVPEKSRYNHNKYNSSIRTVATTASQSKAHNGSADESEISSESGSKISSVIGDSAKRISSSSSSNSNFNPSNPQTKLTTAISSNTARSSSISASDNPFAPGGIYASVEVSSPFATKTTKEPLLGAVGDVSLTPGGSAAEIQSGDIENNK